MEVELRNDNVISRMEAGQWIAHDLLQLIHKEKDEMIHHPDNNSQVTHSTHQREEFHYSSPNQSSHVITWAGIPDTHKTCE